MAANEDHAELRSHAKSVETSSRLAAAAVVAAVVYVLASWSDAGPYRSATLGLLVFAAAWALLPLIVGAEPLARAAHRDSLLLAWTVGSVVLIGAAAVADGGATSPLAVLLFLPLVSAALSYPLWAVSAIGVLEAVALAVAGRASGPHIALLASYLAATAAAAFHHGRQRRALALVSRADPLTGCLNRRGFEERLAADIDAAARSRGTLGLVVLDLDHFKAVNDSRGHPAGDELLRWTVERAENALRPMDSLGRLGGDEFAVVLPGAGPTEAREVAARVRGALSAQVSVSFGVASFPADGTDRETLHRSADLDLYRDKHGRGGERDLHFASALASAVSLRMALPDEERSSVPEYAAAIADRLGFSDQDHSMLRLASTLHDVGKVSVPDRILRKPGPLTIDEFEHVKNHPAAGAEIVAHIDGLSPVAEWIRHSHEHVDGSGYPAGLTGDAIPLAARVLLVADAFDSMLSTRPYGAALPPDAALEELRRGAGTQFDARCVYALEAHLAEHPFEVRASASARKRFTRADAAA
jgi:diguanylate cyclase (GGDEF)-like protein